MTGPRQPFAVAIAPLTEPGLDCLRRDLGDRGVALVVGGRRSWSELAVGLGDAPRLVVVFADDSTGAARLIAASLVARRHVAPLVAVEAGPGAVARLRRSPLVLALSRRMVTRVVGASERPLLPPSVLDQIGVTAAAPRSGVGPLSSQDLAEVVRVHRTAFPDSALSHLGPKVVDRYYRWQFTGDHPAPHASGFWRDGELVGYLFGGVRHDAVSGFARRFLPTVVAGAVTHPGGARRLAGPKVGQVLRLMFRRRSSGAGSQDDVVGVAPAAGATGGPSSRPSPGSSFGVLSIAVHPSAQGSGAATALLRHAEEAARAGGMRQLHLTVDPGNARAVRFYEREGWERVAGADGTWVGKMRKAIDTQAVEDTVTGSAAVE